MKKFFVYSVGVFSWLNSVAVQATEKFEILPDLPDPLAYAVQPAQAAVVTGNSNISALGSQSIGHEPNLISVVLSLFFVILLIYLTGIIYTKLNKINLKTLKKQQKDFSASQVSVISTTPLGNNKTLHVVELDGKRMLIGASSTAIQLIKDLGSYNNTSEEDEYSHIEIPNIKIPKIEIPKIEIPSINFSKLVTKTHKPIDELENENNSTCEFSENKSEKFDETIEVEKEEEKTQQNSVTENPDEIIDSLFPKENIVLQEQEETTISNQAEHVVDPEDYTLYKKYLG